MADMDTDDEQRVMHRRQRVLRARVRAELWRLKAEIVVLQLCSMLQAGVNGLKTLEFGLRHAEGPSALPATVTLPFIWASRRGLSALVAMMWGWAHGSKTDPSVERIEDVRKRLDRVVRHRHRVEGRTPPPETTTDAADRVVADDVGLSLRLFLQLFTSARAQTLEELVAQCSEFAPVELRTRIALRDLVQSGYAATDDDGRSFRASTGPPLATG